MKRGMLCMLVAVLLLMTISAAYAQEAKISVLNPKGNPPPIPLIPMAPRLDTLDGKTIYFVDIGYKGGASLLQEMINWFTKNMPKAKLVFREKAGSYADIDQKLWAEIKEKADAVVMAIGH